MKKSVFAIMAIIFASIVSSAYAGAEIEIKKSTIGKNETTYISAFVVDDKKEQVSTAKVIAKANPSFAVTIGNFINCDTAEGREFCGKMDNSLIGLKGAYVAEVKSKDIEGKVGIDVYVDKKPSSVELNVGSAGVVLASAKTEESKVAAESTPTPTPKLETVKAGREVAGIQYLIIGVILLLAFAYFSRNYKEVSDRL